MTHPPYPRGSWHDQTWIHPSWGWFHASFSCFADRILRRFSKKYHQIFNILTISPFKGAWHFILIILNILYPMMICDMFGWNWFSGSGEGQKCKKKNTDIQTDGQKNKKGTWKLTWAFNSGELKKEISKTRSKLNCRTRFVMFTVKLM